MHTPNADFPFSVATAKKGYKYVYAVSIKLPFLQQQPSNGILKASETENFSLEHLDNKIGFYTHTAGLVGRWSVRLVRLPFLLVTPAGWAFH